MAARARARGKSTRWKLKKSHAVRRQAQGSASKTAFGKTVADECATHRDAGQREGRGLAREVERGEQSLRCIEAPEHEHGFRGREEFDVARQQQCMLPPPREQSPEAV